MSDPAPVAHPADKRCFLALLPDAAGVRNLLRCREALAHSLISATRGVRWVEPTALHLTLRFLGESTTAQVEYLEHMLPTLATRLPAIPSRRFCIWPNRARPRLLVLELDASPTLLELVEGCEQHARKAGFAAETRDFRTHLSVARLRPGCVFGNFPSPPPAIAFDAVALMQSTLSKAGAIHHELARTPCTRNSGEG